MKKLIIILPILFLTSCKINPFKTNNYTHQELIKASNIKLGMSKSEVKALMSSPINTEFSLNKEAWHWCNTGLTGEPDEFIVVLFENNKAIKKNKYFVTSGEVGGAIGSCTKFVRSIF